MVIPMSVSAVPNPDPTGSDPVGVWVLGGGCMYAYGQISPIEQLLEGGSLSLTGDPFGSLVESGTWSLSGTTLTEIVDVPNAIDDTFIPDTFSFTWDSQAQLFNGVDDLFGCSWTLLPVGLNIPTN
jgi:hypothetical protein